MESLVQLIANRIENKNILFRYKKLFDTMSKVYKRL